MALLTQEELDSALGGNLSAWEQQGEAITRTVEAASFPAGIDLVRRVADAAEEAQHHPDIDIRYNNVTFSLSTHSEGGLTKNDLQMAATIDDLAAAGG
jgi:4a-hydroxytetrahydrobiopterin dehydratase